MMIKINGIPQDDSLQKIAEDYYNHVGFNHSHNLIGTVDNAINNTITSFDYYDRFNNVILHKTAFTGKIYDVTCRVFDVVLGGVFQ